MFSMKQNCGIYLEVISSPSVLHGGKVFRRIWQLPNTSHSVLLPVLRDTLPLLDLFFVRMLSFVFIANLH